MSETAPVLGPDGRTTLAYRRRHRSPRKYLQEAAAYERFGGVLAGVPRLRSRADGELTLEVEVAPGRAVGADPFTVALEGPILEAVFRSAGAFLRSLHTFGCVDDDSLGLSEALIARFDAALRTLRSARELSTESSEALEAFGASAWAGAAMARVHCHRDFGPQNWLVDDDGALHVIDWEHARPDWGLLDVERAISRFTTRQPRAAHAFLDGYGEDVRILDSDAFLAARLLAATGRLAWAVKQQDEAFAEDGRAALAALLPRVTEG